jgi:hypothetical protein
MPDEQPVISTLFCSMEVGSLMFDGAADRKGCATPEVTVGCLLS